MWQSYAFPQALVVPDAFLSIFSLVFLCSCSWMATLSVANSGQFSCRSGDPRHGFVVMNRLSTENLVEPITRDLEIQLQAPFLLYKNAKCRLSFFLFFFLAPTFGWKTILNDFVFIHSCHHRSLVLWRIRMYSNSPKIGSVSKGRDSTTSIQRHPTREIQRWYFVLAD